MWGEAAIGQGEVLRGSELLGRAPRALHHDPISRLEAHRRVGRELELTVAHDPHRADPERGADAALGHALTDQERPLGNLEHEQPGLETVDLAERFVVGARELSHRGCRSGRIRRPMVDM